MVGRLVWGEGFQIQRRERGEGAGGATAAHKSKYLQRKHEYANRMHADPKVRPLVLLSQALLLLLGAGFPCWLYESARQALQAPFFFFYR